MQDELDEAQQREEALETDLKMAGNLTEQVSSTTPTPHHPPNHSAVPRPRPAHPAQLHRTAVSRAAGPFAIAAAVQRGRVGRRAG